MGKVYGNRWECLDSVGEGGQAHTFYAKDKRDGSKNWVLKRLKNEMRIDRFVQEIKALKQLNCPHIPKVHDYSINGKPFFVMPYLGVDLFRYASFKPFDEHSVDRVLSILSQLATAVSEAHSIGVVHRDIKPSNIILSDDEATAYLIDFGICQYSEGNLAKITLVDEPFGKPAFAAPECSLGTIIEPGLPSDVYSFGKLIHWMISGQRYISREDINDNAVSRIVYKNKFIRYYFVRLVHGTVKEEHRNNAGYQKIYFKK